jgi:hypothetical protein
VRAGAFAALTVTLLLALRARSDGETPSLLVIFASFVLVAVLARPFTSRERSWLVVFLGLVATQFVLHVAFLYASTGQLVHTGSAGLFCSPASTSTVSSCVPTERGGLLLLGVQLIAAALFATWARGAESTAWQLARRPVRALVRLVAQVIAALFTALTAVLPQVTHSCVAQAQPSRMPRLALLTREHGRRGPPRGRRNVTASVFATQPAYALGF